MEQALRTCRRFILASFFLLSNLQVLGARILLNRIQNKASNAVAYVGVISLGNQDFNVEFNLLSSALFVPECRRGSAHSHDLVNCCDGACNNRNTFVREDSRTFQEAPYDQQISLPFRCSAVGAALGFDGFKPTPHYRPGPLANGVPFALARAMPNCYGDVDYDGVLGLNLIHEQNIPSPMMTLLTRGEYPKKILTFFVLRPSPNNLVDGVVTIGGIDEKCHVPEAIWPVLQKKGWIFRIPKLYVNNRRFPDFGQSYTATVDLNTDFFFVPKEFYGFIVDGLGARQLPATNRFYIPDAAGKTMSISAAEDQQISIKFSDLCDPRLLEKGCVFNIFVTPAGASASFILGTPVLFDHCLILDYAGRMSFAKKKDHQP